MATEVTIGIDIGTTSVKAVAVDGDGNVVARTRISHALRSSHAGELARLLRARGVDVQRTDVEAAPLRHARRAAELTGATVLLKGAVTLVVEAGRPVRSQADGPHWLATAGSGDVLAGLAGALLAAGLTPLDAGALAVAVHGAAGHLASQGGPVSASSVLDAVPHAVRRLLLRDWST